jgi:uncharacterized membrane protein
VAQYRDKECNMSNLIVLAFDTEDGAARMLAEVERLKKMNLLVIEDAATVVRHANGKVKVKQINSLVGAGAFGGAFWGMLIGLLFFAPWLGLAVGAITGALAGKTADIGVDDDFIRSVTAKLQPGTSAVFLMIIEATADRVLEDLRGIQGVTVIQTNLSREAEERLREAFATPERDEVAA